jgi:hypothetical protein
MAKQTKAGKAPVHGLDTTGRSFHPTGFRGSLAEEEEEEGRAATTTAAAAESPGYVLEWNGYTCRRRGWRTGGRCGRRL